jgi:ClpP class serine protease
MNVFVLFVKIVTQNTIYRMDIVNKILNNVWNISPRAAYSYLPFVARMLKNENLSYTELKEIRQNAEIQNRTLYALSDDSGEFTIGFVRDSSLYPKGSVAMMKISGVLQKEPDICSKGIDDYERELLDLGQNGNVEGVVLELHSPGGSAIGIESLSNLVRDFESRFNKPIVALVKSMACSAAYDVAAQAPKIIIDGQSAEVGSIGTMGTIYNYEEFLQQQGLKEIVVRATKSFNKNEPYYQALMGNTEPLQKEVLDPLNEAFIARVKKGRKGKLNLDLKEKDENGVAVPSVFTGRVYMGKEAIDMGLADEIGGTKEAIQYIRKQYKQMQKTSSNIQKANKVMQYSQMSKTELEAKKSELQALSQTDEAVAEIQLLSREIEYRNQSEQLEQMKVQVENSREKGQELDQLKAENIELSSKLDALSAEKSQLEADKQGIESELQAKENKIVQLEAEKQAENEKVLQYEKFIENQYGKEKLVAIQNKETDGSQPRPIERKAVLTNAEKIQEVKNLVKERYSKKG